MILLTYFLFIYLCVNGCLCCRGLGRSLWVGVLIAFPSGAGVALSVLGGNTGSLVGVAISASLLPPAVNAVRISCCHRSPVSLLSSSSVRCEGLGPTGLAIRLFRRLCTKTHPKCGLGVAGLAFRALQMHQAPIFRPFDVHLAVSDMLRSTPTTLSVISRNL